ncbi:MAG: 4Fe-4S ferredoxin [Euryarchaeota archaeon]|nr:4Fe-4S ferredoxin [Euryarchaeota archaeon]
MMTNYVFKLPKNRIYEFLNSLIAEYTVYAPVEGETSRFERITDACEVQFLPNRTDRSLKSIFFPPEEEFFKWKKEKDGYVVTDSLKPSPKKLIFGVRGCDVRALDILDRYMMGEFSDPYYKERRKNTVIIGMTCDYPRSSCFCTAFGGMIPHHYDLWFTDIGAYYLVEVGSDTGMKLIDSQFQKATEQDIKRKNQRIEKVELEIEKQTKINLCETKHCSQKIKTSVEHPMWKELAEICLACGKCNFICPTCHCFDVIDTTNLDGSEGARMRRWDSCHLYEYAKTSAENFRKERHARVRYRVFDKFVFPVMRYSTYACTGCGRCTDICPAGIDIREILREMIA